jgi:hypothetical protein
MMTMPFDHQRGQERRSPCGTLPRKEPPRRTRWLAGDDEGIRSTRVIMIVFGLPLLDEQYSVAYHSAYLRHAMRER